MVNLFSKKLMLIISVMVVGILVLTACGSSQSAAPTQAPTQAPTKAPTEAAPTPTAMEAAAATATEAVTPAAAKATPAAVVSKTGGKIALLLPETKTTRYETADRPDFEAKLKELCPNCEIIYSNANQDANAQLSQAEAALTNGAQVMVLDPVDSASAAAIADKAKAQGVPVIAYDRLILNSDGVNYYISFDNYKVGQLQAQNLVDHLNQLGIKDPTIVMINGSPTDNNAKLFKEGAHSVFDPLVKAGKLTIAKEYDTPDWSPDQAQNEMQQALTALGNKVDGVYCANDGTAGGAIAAMKAAGVDPIPPVTGQDAELAAIQRILSGQQYMTVYKAIKPEAEAAAQLAFDLLTKTEVPASMTEGKTVNNGTMDVPSVLLTPVAVTKDNINDTVVKDGFWTAAQICTFDYTQACQSAGLMAAPSAQAEATPAEQMSTQGVTIDMSNNATLGQYLTDSQGMTLYVFTNDKANESSCYDACAQLWPPLTVKKGEQPTLAAGIPGKLGVIERTDGTYQVTHDGMPLYYYSKDTKAGQANGEGFKNLWHVAHPSGMGAAANAPMAEGSQAAQAAPAAMAPDFSQYGFSTVLASQDITPGKAATITAGPFTVDVPADAFDTPVKFEILTGDLAGFLANAPSGEMPVLDFAFRVTDAQSGQLIDKFNKPVTLTAKSQDVTGKSMYYNITPDGAYTANAKGMEVSTGQLTHPIAGAAVGWVITEPAPAPASGKIALLLPETKTTRYEEKDKPDFEAKFKELCPNCEIIYNNANQDANTQLSQAEAALTNGAQVLVLDPVDSAVSAVIANKAQAQGVPVIAYDRLVLNSAGVSDYVSFDNFKVGQLQAQSLVDKLNQMGLKDPTIVMINGSPADNNGKLFKAGAHSVFDPLVKAGKLTIAKEYDTPDWSPDKAQNEMQQALTALGNNIDAVYCANDGTASGAVAAMKAAGVSPIPPVTGQDAELTAIQRIVSGDQYMTVYKAIKLEADAAAQLAYDQLTSMSVPTSMTNGQTANNGNIDVPAVLLTPLVVTKDNINSTIVKDGYWSISQICTSDYANACKSAGLE